MGIHVGGWREMREGGGGWQLWARVEIWSSDIKMRAPRRENW